MKILGIDPGYDRMGLAVLENTGRKDMLLFSSCVETNRTDDFGNRLRTLVDNLRTITDAHRPDMVALEKLYFKNNQKTAMRVAEARGAILSELTALGLPVREFTPLEIKVAVAGYGKASKEDVARMVGRLVSIGHTPTHDDEYDAIACAITAMASRQYPH